MHRTVLNYGELLVHCADARRVRASGCERLHRSGGSQWGSVDPNPPAMLLSVSSKLNTAVRVRSLCTTDELIATIAEGGKLVV